MALKTQEKQSDTEELPLQQKKGRGEQKEGFCCLEVFFLNYIFNFLYQIGTLFSASLVCGYCV